uniref:Protein sel-1 homolog 1-like n=1 Tax=Sinocyclocheilus grahami TaxID=75366 RepID=A0A672PEG0_SINGR
MAKWGEGDPRWIVEERADATNVNNWHWTERDVTSWSQDAINSLLLGLRVEGEEGSCEITDVSNIDGEASINNRKGKLIYFYEWVVKASWTGTNKMGIKYKGTVEIPNLSDENDMDDLDICARLCKDQPNTLLTDLMRKEGVKKIRMALGNYVKHLKTAFSQGMILPTENAFNKQNQETQAKVKLDKTQIGSSTTKNAPNTGVKISTVSLTMKDTFLTSPEELYRVFLNQEMVQAFTHLAAFVDGCSGGKFRLLEGNVHGQEVYEMFCSLLIVYGQCSSLLLDLETELLLEARGVPSNEEERMKVGWQRYYFDAIKQTFGYGARLC